MKVITPPTIEEEKFRRKDYYVPVRARGYPQAPNDKRFGGTPDQQLIAAHEWQIKTWGWLGGYSTPRQEDIEEIKR